MESQRRLLENKIFVFIIMDTNNKNNKIENFKTSDITDPFKKTGSAITGGFDKVTDAFNSVGDFFKNIFGDISDYLTMSSWCCTIIVCVCLCMLLAKMFK